jgi:thiol-disulfide isomerase/thioredoxin
MRTKSLFVTLVLLTVALCGCRQAQPEYCTVKGTIKGVKDGTKLVLQDEFDHYKEFVSTRVKDGTFEFHPCLSEPTHVYLFTRSGIQLKDFFLEPGTIIVDVDATDEEDMVTGGTGTPTNDLFYRIRQLDHKGDHEAALALWDEVIHAEETGVLALYYADQQQNPAVECLSILDRLSPELARKPYVAELRENLTRRAQVEPAPEGSETAHYFIDMEYADVNGTPISLSSVVNNPDNRYVLLDFWASWCGPCRESIPDLQALYAKYHGKGLEIYSVSEDPYEKEWKKFLAGTDMPWIHVLDDQAGRKSQARKDYVFNGIPTTLLIDGETGEILLRDREKDLDSFLSSRLQ